MIPQNFNRDSNIERLQSTTTTITHHLRHRRCTAYGDIRRKQIYAMHHFRFFWNPSIALFVIAWTHPCKAFVVHAPMTIGKSASISTSALDALPPMIIGPMIKKMREENAKKNMPMADAEETAKEAPGLKVGKDVWKWPPVWPYEDSFFKPVATISSPASEASIKNMASILSGVAQAPTGTTDEAESFDALHYWSQADGAQPTNLDPEAIEKLRQHYAFYLKDGMSILELGAAEDSYLPKDLQLSRHVGVGASPALLENNPSLTETLVVDLNKVVKSRDVDDDNLRRLAQQPFDAIIMANTVDYLAFPREVFRSAWYLLKPGGIMIVSFAGKEATKDKFTEAVTKMWREYNDDQHLWITGSFFQFSAGDGWETLLGFDISPESAKKPNTNLLEGILDRGKPNNMYVVQAVKGDQDESIDPENVERSINSLCWMLPVLEERDKALLLPRLARTYETTQDESVQEAIERNIPVLPVVYEALIKMDTFAFTFSMQAQLATDLISDPDFTANDEQMLALKQGLGLRTPSAEFWVPIGQNTANMEVEERISLLAYIVPRFGSGDPDQEEALQAFATGLKPTYEIIRSKCPKLAAGDVELLGTELLAAEVLTTGRSTRDEFAAWLCGLSGIDLQKLLSNRKSIRIEATRELDEYKKGKEEEKARLEEYRRMYEEQLQTARTERSLIFNPKTQKMQIYERPK
jgi:SAM-dependent methyltransferase